MENNVLVLLLEAGLVGSVFSFVTTVLQRKWSKNDKKEDRDDKVLQAISELKIQLKEHEKNDELDKIKRTRSHILRFNDELKRGIRHSEESFNDILEDIDRYLSFCDTHKDYPNSKADAAIKHIKEIYYKCMHENDFL